MNAAELVNGHHGRVAQRLVAGVKAHGGIWSLRDLSDYHVVEREPVITRYHDIQVVSAPPPSSGGLVLAQVLKILEGFDLDHLDDVTRKHVIIEAMRRAWRDRAAYLGDPDFVRIPTDKLLDHDYIEGLAASIRLDRATPSEELGMISTSEPAGTNTTHFSVLDDEGNRVAATLSINLPFGSGYVAEGTGVILNDEMDDFASKPGSPNMFGLVQGEANAIAPYKRPLSSMTPTMVLEEGPEQQKHVRLILGSPGGGTIINTVLEVLLNVVQFKMDVLQAVTAPRFHDQWMPDRLFLERFGFSADTIQKLRESGYVLNFVNSLGNCEAIEVRSDKGGWRFGAADPRGEGKAAGY